MSLLKVVSGGQTGSDMAGLLAARIRGIETGGYIPKGFKTERGPRPSLARWGLVETKSSGYIDRTKMNVEHSDATMIVSQNFESKGTILTEEAVRQYKKNCFKYVFFPPYQPMKDEEIIERMADWIGECGAKTLNIAGNRESVAPGLQFWLTSILMEVFTLTQAS